jgi:hypothetical protein
MQQYESLWKKVFVGYAALVVLSIIIDINTDSYFWSDLFSYLWLGGGIAGLFLFTQKGYLLSFGLVGCGMWLLVGWWAILLLIIFCPFTWLVALFLEPKKKCRSCRKVISVRASICPHCGTQNPTE